MIATMVPMFRDDMSVAAYCLFTLRENLFQNPHLLGTGSNDGAGNLVGMEVINNLTIDGLSKDSLIIIPVNNISIFADIDGQCKGPKDRIMLMLDPSIKPDEAYTKRVLELKKSGYKLAMKKLQCTQAEAYKELLKNFDCLFVNCNYADPVKQAKIFNLIIPGLDLGVENIKTQEQFEEIKKSGVFKIFEGEFYRLPINKHDTEVTPLKINYMELLNIINKPDFDLTKVADVISKDPALTISLLNVVNKLTINSNISSIKQATAMLGQRELKKWLNTSIISNLCADKPNEITRLSLIRAKFAENLSSVFSMGMKTEQLFLMGLFSLLDYILDEPMEQALSHVNVSKEIYDALVNDSGDLSKVLDFQLSYENANWQEVSRLMVLNDISMEVVYDAYVDALKWYKNMFM